VEKYALLLPTSMVKETQLTITCCESKQEFSYLPLKKHNSQLHASRVNKSSLTFPWRNVTHNYMPWE